MQKRVVKKPSVKFITIGNGKTTITDSEFIELKARVEQVLISEDENNKVIISPFNISVLSLKEIS